MDFKAALRRLKNSLNLGQPPPGQVGTDVAGSVHGDAVGGDKVGGDKVAGDKIEQHTTFDQSGQTVGTQYNVVGTLTISQPAGARVPLLRPPRAVHFTNREKELAQLLADLQPGRVVTLCGPGGMGKSALAAEAVWHLAPELEPPASFPDGILFHSFYNQPEAAMALENIARACGEEPKPSPAAAAQRALAGKRCLLLLDGTEDADDLPAVLRLTAGCGVLVTSRNRGDAVASRQDLAPLPVDEAASLLQQWGGPLAGDGEIAGRICRQVGRLPLAVRLAGKYLAETDTPAADYLAWLEQTPIEALSQGHHREQSVAVLLERSLTQISPTARELLGVAGLLALAPFSLAPLAAALGLDESALRRPLDELVRFGLLLREAQPSSGGSRERTGHQPYGANSDSTPSPLRVPPARGRSHSSPPAGGIEGGPLPAANTPSLAPTALDATGQQPSPLLTSPSQREGGEPEPIQNPKSKIQNPFQVSHALIHTYARETLPPATETVRRLIVYYEAWVEEQISHQAAGFRRIDAERLHLIRLLDECVSRAAWAEAKRLAWAMDDYLSIGGRALERQQVDGVALTAARRLGDRRDEGAFLTKLGLAANNLGQVSQAIDYYEQALQVAREIEHKQDEGIALGNLGNAYRDLGQVERAIDFYQQALAIAQEIGDRRGEGNRLGNLGLAYSDLSQSTDYPSKIEVSPYTSRNNYRHRSAATAV